MPRVKVIDLQAFEGLHGLLQLAAVGATAHQCCATVQRYQGIAAQKFEAEGIVQAQTFRRMAGAGDDAPIQVVGQAADIF